LHTALGFTSGAIALSALVLGTGIFFIIPRYNAGYLSRFNLQPTLISGFSDDVELGEIGQIKLSSAVVMRVKVEGGRRAGDLRWRGIALTTFDGHRWFTDGLEPTAISQGADGWIGLQPVVPNDRRYLQALRYTVYLQPMASDAIFVAAEPARIREQLSNEIGPGLRRSYLVLDKTGSLTNPFHNFSNVSYDAVSVLPQIPADLLRAAPTDYPQEFRDMYLQLPHLDPRIPALARQIIGRATNPYDQARAIELYLRSNFAYSLDLSGPAPADPLATFLFEKRAGHCEYFAAAMTVMLRSLGVPARYINGFLPGDYNELGGDYIVRARDAHSWVEVFFPGYGWQTFDPTPSSAEAAAGIMTRLGYYVDWFELQWSEWVVNYDFLHQYTLAQGLQRASRDWTTTMRDKFQQAKTEGVVWVQGAQTQIKATPVWLPILLVALFIALLLARSNGMWQRLALRWKLRQGTGALPAHAASFFYLRALRLLERRGWKKSAWQTPAEFAASLPAGQVAVAVTELTETYQSARFGSQSADAGHVSELLGRLQAALRTAPSRG
jgi:transglutaminase-like putative cysteine protease